MLSKIIKICPFLILLFSLGCAAGKRETTAEKKATLYYNQGTNNLVNKDYTDALRNLLEAYKLRPKNSQINNNLGMAYYFKGDHANALRFLRKAVELSPENSDARLNLGTVYMRNNHLDMAQIEYEKVQKDLLYKAQYKVEYNLAELALKRKRPKLAEKHLKKAIEMSSGFCAAHFLLGEISSDKKDYEEALKHYHNSGLGSCYNNIAPFIRKAQTLIKLKRYTDARILLHNTIKRFPSSTSEDIARQELRKLNRLEGIYSELDDSYAPVPENKVSSPDF